MKDGLKFSQEDRDGVLARHPLNRGLEWARNIEDARIYRDEDSDPPFEPKFVLGGIARDTYEYIDFDINETEADPYYYCVMSVIKGDGLIDKDPWNRRTESPLMSPPVEVTPYTCIPVDEISKEVISLGGHIMDPLAKEDYRYQWDSRTVRTFLGPYFDRFLDRADELAETLSGLVQTSSDAMVDYIDFLSNKIRGYIKIIQVIAQIIQVLVSFRMRGSLLLLSLDPEDGGIRNFASRIRDSVIGEQITLGALSNETTASPGALASIQSSLYFGLIGVYGFPNDPTAPGYLDQYTAPYEQTYEAAKKRLEKNQTAIKLLLKLLTGKD